MRQVLLAAVIIISAIMTVRADDGPQVMLDTGGHMGIIKGLIFTPDGKQLISGGEDKVIRVWDIESGTTVRTIRGQIGPGPEGKIYGMGLSPDGRLLAVAGWMGVFTGQKPNREDEDAHKIRIIDFETGEIVRILKGHTNVVEDLKFSPDGKRLITSSHDYSAIIWDVQTGRMIHRLTGHKDHVYAATFTLDGLRAVTASDDRTVKLWDARTGRLIATMTGHGNRVKTLAISPVDGFIVSGGDDGEIRVWDEYDGRQLRVLGKLPYEIGSLSFSPDGRFLLSTCGGGPPCGAQDQVLWDVETGQQRVRYRNHDNIVIASAISPDSRLAATAGGGSFPIHIWDMASGRTVKTLVGKGKAIWAVGFSRDGNRIAWGETWKIHTTRAQNPLERELMLPLAGNLGQPRAIDEHMRRGFVQARARIGDMALIHKRGGNYGGDAILDVVAQGKTIASIMRDSTSGYDHRSYGFTADGTMFFSGGSNGFLTAYDINGTRLGDFVGHEGDVWALTPSPDGRYLVSGSADQTVRLWNAETRELIVSLFYGTDGEWVLWTPQGFYAASPGGDALVGWQINRGMQRAADYVTARQLKSKFFRPDVVERAIILASAKAAADEARAADFQLAELVNRKPVEFDVMNPKPNARVIGSPVPVKLAVKANKDPLKSIEVTVNGRQVTTRAMRGLDRPTPQAHERELEIPLEKGENRIRIVAANAVGETVRELLLYHAGPETTLDKKGKLYIVAIGVDNYVKLGNQAALRFAGADARAIHDTLKEKASGLYSEVKSVLLARNGGQPPTRNNIEDAIALFSEAGPEDTVVLFLAGHGVNQGPDYLFLPEDAEKDGERWRASTVMRWQLMQLALQSSQGRRIMLVDTCHSGGAFNARLMKDAADANIVVFSATDANTLAQEKETLGHGVFTYSILQGLRGKANLTQDNVISVLELGSFISGEVERITGGAQRPTFHLAGTTNFPLVGQ